MQTTSTSANLAIVALARSIAVHLEAMSAVATQAEEAATVGEFNGTVGALMCVADKVPALSAQLTAVLELHKANR
jgi:hypothetical protein